MPPVRFAETRRAGRGISLDESRGRREACHVKIDPRLRARAALRVVLLGALLPLHACGGPPQRLEDASFRAGEGVVDITPPPGTELAGFHKAPGAERRSKGVRMPSFARALVLSARGSQVALVSLDVCGVSQDFCRGVKAEIARTSGLPPQNVRITATHTHSMPTLRPFRLWGGFPQDYARTVSARVQAAVDLARRDLAPAEFRLGRERVAGGNFNRTAKTWKTDDLFTAEATEGERWLDTTLHALVFARGEGRPPLVWYQFSAHPVCYGDDLSGPDWPGLVAETLKKTDGVSPSLLQGHCGDVNPGSGTPWLGDPRQTSDAVAAALRKAVGSARPVKVDEIRQVTGEFAVPLDLGKHREQLERYRSDPASCTKGEWVDAEFARQWAEVASRWDLGTSTHGTPLSALRLGDVALLFHSGELYSYFGLALRRDSPFADTVVVGYADDLIGYVPDPKAYAAGEYAALVVPKIMDLPRFDPQVGRAFTRTALDLLARLRE
jgi:neutral ceramidase